MTYVDLKSTGSGGNKNASSRQRTVGKKKGLSSYFPSILFAVAIVIIALNIGKIGTAVASILNPINIVTTATGASSAKIKEDDGRTNILILGVDGRITGGMIGSQLTDTIMIISVSRSVGDAVMISVPRDLWVKSSTGGYYKINELYATYGGKGGTGTQEVLSAVENALKIPIHYHVVVNFALFKNVIDTLGGVEVNVETAFTDSLYPIEGKEDAEPESARYETISFAKGTNRMDGELALKYARSRHGDNDEGTDFARARRQQNLIKAVKDKALSPQTLLDISKIKSLYELYAKNLDTDLDLSSVQLFYELTKFNSFDNIRALVLDDRSEGENGGLLYNPTDLTLYGGKYVLIPKAGDYSQIHAYIQKYLFN